MPTAGDARGVPELVVAIRDEIRRAGPLSFARFMDLALYHERWGYYASSAERLGPRGDYFTASDLGPAFGRCLARQIVEIDALAGPFPRLDVVELGAGRGLLGRDVLEALGELAPALRPRARLTLVDRSPAMRRAAGLAVPVARVLRPDELEDGLTGVLIAVELFDALPVHRVRRVGGALRELLVDAGPEGGLVEREGEPGPEVADWARRYGAAAAEGTEAEVGLAALGAVDAIARTLGRGVAVVVDYGDDAAALYGVHRPRGTLLAYRRHATSERFLERVGQQDLTAHVNFSALEERARERGLVVLGRTTQDRFLVANGLLEEFAAPTLEASRDPARVRARLQALQLLHPHGMGRAFRVLLLARDCGFPAGLAGLRDPFRRD